MPKPVHKTDPRQKPTRLQWFGNHFKGFTKNGTGYKALCPLHDDNTPSLSIKESDGKLLVFCHAGCKTDHLLEVVGLSLRDLMPGAKHIVATYDYVDENGEVLYQTVRYEPKTFRQRCPKPDGGWSWSTKNCRRVLYNLPEIIEADPSVPVFVVGGEKDADRLCDLGLQATTNVGGEGKGKWLDQYSETLRDRHVVILPDNDPTGYEHADYVSIALTGIAKSVKVLQLPGLPEKGDVSDWLDRGGTRKTLEAFAKNTQPNDPSPNGYEKPNGSSTMGSNTSGSSKKAKDTAVAASKPDGRHDGFTPRVSSPMGVGAMGSPTSAMGKVHVPPFPVEVFPGQLQDFITSTAEALPCPPDFSGAMMLAVLGTYIGRKRCIEVKKSWREYALLWIACVARSGERKSPAYDIVTQPLRQTQAMLLSKYIRDVAEWERDGKEGPKPLLRQILTTDTTIEALKKVLAVSTDGVIYTADELAGWVRSIGQYKSGKGDDRQIWLSFWSGTQVVTNRVSNPEPTIINNPFVSIVGGIQPDALGDLINLDREDGLSARVLFSWPDPILDNAWTEHVLKQHLVYTSLCTEQLWDMESSTEPVRFSPSAKDIWVEWVNKHREQKPEDALRATWSKAEGHCLRLTLILHLARFFCNVTRSKDVDVKSIQGGIALVEYFKSHAQRVYGFARVKTDDGKVAKALRWVRKHGPTVTARVAAMNGFTRDSSEAKVLFHHLEELGHGTVEEGKQGSVSFTLHAD